MEPLTLAIVLILFVIYIVVFALITDRFYRRWEAEYAETKRRKEEILQKRSLDEPYHCPYCGEAIPPALSDHTNCSKCGRVIMTKQDNPDGLG